MTCGGVRGCEGDMWGYEGVRGCRCAVSGARGQYDQFDRGDSELTCSKRSPWELQAAMREEESEYVLKRRCGDQRDSRDCYGRPKLTLSPT